MDSKQDGINKDPGFHRNYGKKLKRGNNQYGRNAYTNSFKNDSWLDRINGELNAEFLQDILNAPNNIVFSFFRDILFHNTLNKIICDFRQMFLDKIIIGYRINASFLIKFDKSSKRPVLEDIPTSKIWIVGTNFPAKNTFPTEYFSKQKPRKEEYDRA